MTPAARIQATIEIISALAHTAQPADRFLRDWFRRRRYAGAKDRAAVAEHVYNVFRHRASFAWRMGRDDPRALVIASLLTESDSQQLEAIFTGSRYGPASLDEAEKRAIASPPTATPPNHVLGEFPQWLKPKLSRSLGFDLLPEMKASLVRAPIDLRANSLKSTRETISHALYSLGFVVEATPLAPNGLRLASTAGLRALQETESFQQGLFEFQD